MHRFMAVLLLGSLAPLALAADAKPEDPAATKLLAEARAARATWKDFPGFTAAIEVNLDGQVSKGEATVDPAGKVTLTGLDKAAEAWARRQLAMLVAHRAEFAADRPTPCAFADNDTTHPLGRLVLILNDELHSSYRIKDKQIMVVNRLMDDSRFSITMQDNHSNAEGKFLPISYVVTSWDPKTGRLTRSEAHHQSWQRVEKFDLPVLLRVVTAADEEKGNGLSARSLTLTGHKLR
jgi:hypothetical protein